VTPAAEKECGVSGVVDATPHPTSEWQVEVYRDAKPGELDRLYWRLQRPATNGVGVEILTECVCKRKASGAPAR
jgi:hypothetical protein